jgi:hypothetical protein
MKIAVIVHLFYADWRNRRLVGNIPIDFGLFVSVPREYAGTLRALVLRDHPQAQVLEVPNAGRDVGAFSAVLPRVLAGNYSVLCKLHSKKGTECPAAWVLVFVSGKNMAVTQTRGERPDVTKTLGLAFGAERNVGFEVSFGIRTGDHPIVVSLGSDKQYLSLSSAQCP